MSHFPRAGPVSSHVLPATEMLEESLMTLNFEQGMQHQRHTYLPT